jgi:hypothetical protein
MPHEEMGLSSEKKSNEPTQVPAFLVVESIHLDSTQHGCSYFSKLFENLTGAFLSMVGEAPIDSEASIVAAGKVPCGGIYPPGLSSRLNTCARIFLDYSII